MSHDKVKWTPFGDDKINIVNGMRTMVNDNVNKLRGSWEKPTKEQKTYLEAVEDNLKIIEHKLNGDFYLIKLKREKDKEPIVVKEEVKKKKEIKKPLRKRRKL